MADNNNEFDALDYEPDIISLTDEDGKECSFEVIDAADYNDNRYMALVPYADSAAERLEEDAQLILMRVDADEDGEEFLSVVDEDNELYEVGQVFATRLKDVFNIDPEDIGLA